MADLFSQTLQISLHKPGNLLRLQLQSDGRQKGKRRVIFLWKTLFTEKTSGKSTFKDRKAAFERREMRRDDREKVKTAGNG